MITIGVVSDTHIPGKSKGLPIQLLDALSRVDMIIHAGDISRDYVVYELEELARVHAVAGNIDDEHIENLFGKKKIIAVNDCRIGIIHGDGVSGKTLERVRRAFAGDRVQCVVFGHSHIPLCEKIEGTLYFNSGSPTDKRRQEFFSYGLLYVDGNNINGEIKYF